MESRFDMTNFEQSLREQADQFTMIPSKKVWNGIYNSLHPGSVWPSISMLLLFLMALVGIGPLNNAANSFKTNSTDNFKGDLAGNSKIISVDADAARKSMGIFNIKNYILSDKISSNITNVTLPGKVVSLQSHLQRNRLSGQDKGNIAVIKMETVFNNTVNEKSVQNSGSLENTRSVNLPLTSNDIITVKGDVIYKEVAGTNIQTPEPKGLYAQTVENALGNYQINVQDPHDSLFTSFINSKGKSLALIQPEIAEEAQEEIQSAGESVKTGVLKKKKNARVIWIFYATPTVSSVYFNGKALKDNNPQNNNLSPIIINPNQVGNQMRYNARAGLNIGTEMNYSVADGWQLTSGVQLSYSGYNILSHKVHPSFAELVLRNNDYGTLTKRYITYYGSGEGQDEITLHNNSFQISMPVGVSHSVWKNNNVEISISATIEPLMVLHSNAYMLSADGKNYVNDPELMRQTNVNGQLGASISFSGEKVKWHIGPVIRYQALSTFKNIYPINEHLIDYGIRIGISK